MSTHRITAGHGYTYLTRQTAAQDGRVVGAGGLGAYYAEHGEAPGQWLGSGLTGLGIDGGATVSEAQMVALFGEGKHPDAAAIAARLRAEGTGEDVVAAATELGKPFALNLANSEFRRQVAQLITEWNRDHGEPASAAVPAHTAALIRTVVGQALFAAEHGREPDARELSDFIARASRIGSKAVAGFDLTFSPVKSVSVLWALAPEPVAAQIEAAHHAAVADTIAWLEREATFTRLGRNGIRQVETRGLIAAAFVHRTSRAGDPDLHTHVAVANKVQTLDGRWRALDGRVLFKATVAASERYNTRLEAELRERLGVEFADRQRPGRRPVREIVGVDDQLIALWSKRRAVIDVRRGELAEAFEAEHGRPPTPVEAIELTQRATLETRPKKPAAGSATEQRTQWRGEAIDAIGETALQGSLDATLLCATGASTVQRTLDATLRHPVGAPEVAGIEPASTTDRPLALQDEDIRDLAQRVVDRVQADRATWQRWHVTAETQRQLRRLPIPPAELAAAFAQVVASALDECSIALPRPGEPIEPDALRRSDGASVYTVAGSQLFTSRTVLAAEQSLLAAGNTLDGQRVTESAIEMALLEATANGLVLNDGQIGFVRALAGSGARLQVALAPAGTGKTTALKVLAGAWAEDGGRIVALAPSAAAARLLGQATGTDADTLAKQLQLLDTASSALDRRTLVLVDEAGLASTPDLARLMAHAIDAGASVRLIGDDRQLAAIGAGGILRDLAETTGAVTLTAAVRFTDADEATAALGIRDGAPDALDFYLDHGRVHVGDQHTAATSAYKAWHADRAAGKDALLLAATRDQVSALNARARADRLAAAGEPVDRELPLADGTAVSAGDAIITRHNDRRLGITATDWVKNGDRWTVATVLDGGHLRVVHRDTGRYVTLPANYVAEHVALGYAVTIHGAQGSTADTCHTVLTGTECREQLYVALSRGRHANHVHVVTPGAADDHAAIRSDSLIPPTATDVLRRVLDREESARSASTAARAVTDPTRQLQTAVERYSDSVALAPSTSGAPPTHPAPLPWLPPVPACDDDTWRTYLAARSGQIVELADEITRRINARANLGSVVNRRDPTYLTHTAIWTATHPGDDRNALSEREQLYERHLQERRLAIHDRAHDDRRRWLPLVSAIDAAAVRAPEYAELARALTSAFDRRLDVDRLLPQLLAKHDYARAIAELDNRGHQSWRDWQRAHVQAARPSSVRAGIAPHVPHAAPTAPSVMPPGI
jgi:conjugative relaxase-like TrwC/TraI family protein